MLIISLPLFVQGNRIGINKNLIELDIIMGGGT